MKKLALYLVLAGLFGCNIGGNRYPANDYHYKETNEPVAFAQLKLITIERGLREVVEKSPILKSLDRFEMDPMTRILNVKMTVDYPIQNLFDFTQIPKNDISDLHDIEFSVSFPETKTLSQSRYLGLTFHKFKIDGDDYLGAFEIIASVVKTVLANSELVTYLYRTHTESIPDNDFKLILQEVLDENGIVVFHTTRKINFKLDLSKFARLNPYTHDYDNLRLWRFSPTLFEGEEVRFKVIAGEGKPTDKWLNSQEAKFTEDKRTLLQVRTELYQTYSDINNVEINNTNFFKQLLGHENIDLKKIPKNYQSEASKLLSDLKQKAQKYLSRNNENYLADPEYEYLQYTELAQGALRNYVYDLDRRLSLDKNILLGGDKTSEKKPLITKLISQDLLNKGMNFLVDIELQGGNQLFTEAQAWLMPQLPGIALKGKVHLPIDYLLGQMNEKLIGKEIDSKIEDDKTGYPVEILLESRMTDNGVLALDIKQLKIQSGKSELKFDRNSKNQNFLFDLTKLYLANTLSTLKIDTDNIDDPEAAKQAEIDTILSYLNELRSEYVSLRSMDLATLMLKDILYNPYIEAGQDHLNKKREILIGQIFSYNEASKLFEMKLDPNIAVDKINNVSHNLQVWSVAPLYSKELNNTFLEFSIGHGLRSQKYIDNLYFRGGNAENSQFSGIYYDLGKEQSTVDLLFSLNFDYLKYYINHFLAEMTQVNSVDIKKQAEENKGESFFEVGNVNIDITSANTIKLDMQIKKAVYERTFRRLWLSSTLKEDTYSISANLKVESKEVPVGANSSLKDLQYSTQAISLIPTNVNIVNSSPYWVNRAITKLLSSAANLALNNGTMKKLLLKMVGKHLSKMYAETANQMYGHPMEKIARLQATSQDLLVFLNPKLAGQAFDVHLTQTQDPVKSSIKLDSINQTMHVALTSGVTMAKQDKKDLIDLVVQTKKLVGGLDQVKSKEDLLAILDNNQLIGKLITNSDKEKPSVYNQYLALLNKYDQVLHTVKIPHQSELQRTRITAAGSELMYFAGVAFKLNRNLSELISKMEKFGLTSKNEYYPSFVEAKQKINDNILIPLIEEYRNRNHRINKTVISNKISYWTYQVYPDAYLAEEIFKLIAQK